MSPPPVTVEQPARPSGGVGTEPPTPVIRITTTTHRTTELRGTMNMLNVQLADTVVKDRQRDLHRVAGNSRPHRSPTRWRERQRRSRAPSL
jgi:hypothetical protein